MKQIVLFNFKTYKGASGKNAIKLAKLLASVQKKYKNYVFVIIPQLVDIKSISEKVKIPIFAQHIDDVGYGKFTGFVNPSLLKSLGVKGTLINHSEHRLNYEEIKRLVKLCNKLGLKSIVCCKNNNELKKIVKLKPSYVAIEPPELIGGKVSIASAKPGLIKSCRKICPNLIIGAGICSHEDIVVARKMKVKGILLASNFVNAKDHKKWLNEFLGD